MDITHNITENPKHKLRRETCEFIDSFVYEENFVDKRFSKYINSAKFSLYQYCEEVCPNVKGVNDFDDFIIKLFQNIYSNNIEIEDLPKGTFFKLITVYYVKFSEISPNLNNTINILFQNEELLREIIDNEFALSIKDYIREQIALDSSINKGNYFKTLPSNANQYLTLLSKILNRVYIDIERFIKSNITESYFNVINNEVVLKLDQDLEELTTKFNNVNEENKRMQSQIAILQQRIENSESKSKDSIKLINETNEELIRKLSKLQTKYNHIVDKYNNIEISEVKESIEEKIEFSIDCNLKYGFVIGEDNTIQQNIKEVFPNSIFIHENENIDEDIKLIIFITSYMGHSLYYGIKAQCKTKGIPYIHSSFTNVELIKELIKINNSI